MRTIRLSEDEFLTKVVLDGEGYITAEQSLTVLRRIGELRERGEPGTFGELAVAMGYALPADYRYTQYLIGQLKGRGGRRPVGYYILAKGYARPTHVLEALEEQLQLGGRLGEIMIRNGWLTEAHLEECLALQSGQPVPAAV